MKKGIRLIAAAAALLAALVIALFVYVDTIAGRAIESGASYALGVDTKVGFVAVAPISGFIHIGSLKVRNPPGAFDERYLLVFDDTRINVDVGTLRKDVIVASDLTIDGVEVDLEKDGGQTNFGKVLANLDRFEEADAGGADPDPGAPGKRIVVKELLIRNLVAHYEHTDGIGDLGKVLVEVPEIRVVDIGTHNARGVAMAELTDIIVKAVFLAIARNGAALPNWLMGDMLGDLRGLTELPVQIVGGSAGALVDSLPQSVGNAAGELGAKAGEALEGLGDLFGGDERDGER